LRPSARPSRAVPRSICHRGTLLGLELRHLQQALQLVPREGSLLGRRSGRSGRYVIMPLGRAWPRRQAVVLSCHVLTFLVVDESRGSRDSDDLRISFFFLQDDAGPSGGEPSHPSVLDSQGNLKLTCPMTGEPTWGAIPGHGIPAPNPFAFPSNKHEIHFHARASPP